MYDQDFESCSAPAAASHLVGSKTGFNNRREFQLSDRNLLIFLAFLTFFFLRKNASDARKKRSNKQNRF